jgi:hypothetical protein
MKRFNLIKLNKVEAKEQYQEIGLQLWKTDMLMWISVEFEKILDRISIFQPKRV